MPPGIGYNPYTSLRPPSISLDETTNPLFFNPYSGFDPNQMVNQANTASPEAGGPQVDPSQIIGGGLGFASSLYGIFNNQTLDPLVQNPQIDPDNPVLDTSSYMRNIAANSDAEAKAAGNAGVASGAISGAKLGSAFGPLGAFTGGFIGAGLGLIGKGKRRREAEEQRKEAERLHRANLSRYNRAVEADLVNDSVYNRIRQQRQFPTSTFSLI